MNFARLMDLPEILRARALTRHYRKTGMLDQTARIGEGGRILDAGDRRRIRVGANSVMRGELFTFAHGGTIDIGSWCFVGQDSYIWSASSVRIGDRVLISHGVNIHDTNGHPIDAKDRHLQYQAIATSGHPVDIATISSKPIVIEDDVWIGFGCVILKGVTIGARTIIGAGSVVLEDVPADSRVGGNPARALGSDSENSIEDWPQYAG